MFFKTNGFIFLFVFCTILRYSGCVNRNSGLRPVILVPGDGGSQIIAKLNKPSTVHEFCSKTTADYFPLWLNLELMAPYILDCFVDNMRLVYNVTTRSTQNSPGVSTKVPGFGNTSTVEWLDSSHISPTTYYAPLVEAAVIWGYKRGVSIRGAPYDFRKAPNEASQWLDDFKKLIENTFYSNDNQRVVLICHSMGNVYTLFFLNSMQQSWKDKFIQSFVSLSGPWGGAAKILRLMASGDNLGIYVVNPLTIRREQRSMPSSAFLMPSPRFWNKDEVLVTAPTGNYTVNDYERFFTDINYKIGWYMREDTKDLIVDLKPPGVEVHCLHGTHVNTPAVFHYTKDTWPDSQPKVTYSDGDGTVNMRSLLGCLRWQKQQKQEVHHGTFYGADHMGILQDERMIKYIEKVLTIKV